jgi:soluble lytic murein transglycosylase-like protein
MNSIILLISFLAPQYNIAPETAIAVAQTESSLNPSAIGPIGEVGLFQVRPEYSKFTSEELLDINTNIHEGLRILSEAKSRCKHQSERTWLNCYNLGLSGGSKIKHPKRFPYYLKVMNRIADAN